MLLSLLREPLLSPLLRLTPLGVLLTLPVLLPLAFLLALPVLLTLSLLLSLTILLALPVLSLPFSILPLSICVASIDLLLFPHTNLVLLTSLLTSLVMLALHFLTSLDLALLLNPDLVRLLLLCLLLASSFLLVVPAFIPTSRIRLIRLRGRPLSLTLTSRALLIGLVALRPLIMSTLPSLRSHHRAHPSQRDHTHQHRSDHLVPKSDSHNFLLAEPTTTFHSFLVELTQRIEWLRAVESKPCVGFTAMELQ